MTPPPLEVQGVVLGIVQGITEFLPISSSAHLVALPKLLGWPYLGKTFDVALHCGTLGALVSHYRRELGDLFRAGQRLIFRFGKPADAQERTFLALAIATVPGALGGYLLDGVVEQYLHGLGVVAAASLVWGTLLAWADRRAADGDASQLGWRQALVVGCAQMAALFPGTSRSGATMTAGLALGFQRAEAARFSMLCSVPLVAGAVVYKGAGLLWNWPELEVLRTMLFGAFASMIVGRLCLQGFVRYLESGSFQPFAYYRIGFGLALLLWVVLQVL